MTPEGRSRPSGTLHHGDAMKLTKPILYQITILSCLFVSSLVPSKATEINSCDDGYQSSMSRHLKSTPLMMGGSFHVMDTAVICVVHKCGLLVSTTSAGPSVNKAASSVFERYLWLLSPFPVRVDDNAEFRKYIVTPFTALREQPATEDYTEYQLALNGQLNHSLNACKTFDDIEAAFEKEEWRTSPKFALLKTIWINSNPSVNKRRVMVRRETNKSSLEKILTRIPRTWLRDKGRFEKDSRKLFSLIQNGENANVKLLKETLNSLLELIAPTF